MVAAVVLLAGWLERRHVADRSPAGVAVMLCLPAISRFAQEARPYGLTVCADRGLLDRLVAGPDDDRAGADDLVLGQHRGTGAESGPGTQCRGGTGGLPRCCPTPTRHGEPLIGRWSRTVLRRPSGSCWSRPSSCWPRTAAPAISGTSSPSLHNVWAIAAAALTGEPREARVVDQIAWLVVASGRGRPLAAAATFPPDHARLLLAVGPGAHRRHAARLALPPHPRCPLPAAHCAGLVGPGRSGLPGARCGRSERGSP